MGQDKIVNTYTANGVKIQELRIDDAGDTLQTRNYLGPAVYTNDNLQFVTHGNGRVVPGACRLTLNHSVEFDGQRTFTAGTIRSTATMLDNSDIAYQAGTEITLNAGFNVELGAEFSADVVPCPPGEDWVYQYYLADHLGNNRVLFADMNGNGTVETNEILQENHYYAFGMEMAGDWQSNASGPEHRYRYNGMERSKFLDLYFTNGPLQI